MKLPIGLPVALLSSILLLLAGPGGATSQGDSDTDSGVKINPGMWQVTTTSKIPMVDQTTSDTHMQCLSENYFTPERVTGNHKSCKIDKVSSNDNEMSWTMLCKTPTGEFGGDGRFKSTGNKAEGQMTTTMKIGDHPLVTKMKWQGIRLGDCDMELPKKPKKNKKAADQASGAAPDPAADKSPSHAH